jgi:hypothetical protein
MFSSATEEQIDYVCKSLLEILEQRPVSCGAGIGASVGLSSRDGVEV